MKIENNAIIIVSGLPRSGTSMMMRMLEAGGITPMTDNIRKSDEDNPKGYYEFERVKKIREDASWLDECRGKVVKMVSALLYDLPREKTFKVVFMKRDLNEIIASQNAMLKRLGRPKSPLSDAEMAEKSANHIRKLEGWLSMQPNLEVLYLKYRDVVEKPRENAKIVSRFLRNSLDIEKMAGVVEASLYRQRSGKNETGLT
ncbi:sulfotransferase domain-containing protein [Thermodesulfobacteriota bacterium]